VTSILTIPARFLFERYIKQVSTDVKMKYQKEEYNKYQRLTYDSKNKVTADTFRRKLQSSTRALSRLLVWGIPEIAELIVTFVIVLRTFYLNSLFIEFVLLCAFNVVVYFFVTKKLQNKLASKREKIMEKNNNLSDLVDHYLPKFETGDKTAEDITKLENEMSLNWMSYEISWTTITMLTNLSNTLGLLIFLFDDKMDKSYFLVISSSLVTFTASIVGSMRFFNSLSTSCADYKKYNMMWKGKEFRKDVTKLEMKDTTEITEIDIQRGKGKNKFTLVGDGMTIKKGGRYLIRGPSGGGKSTLIKAMLGQRKGISFLWGVPANFYHNVVEFYQNIKEKMPTTNITIRQLFDDEKDNTLIEQCLETAGAIEWAMKLEEDVPEPILKSSSFTITQWLRNLLSGGKYKKDDEESMIHDELIVLKKKHPFDVKIMNSHSGGEKTRLALATKLYSVIKKKASWLILDEPEQGSDPEIAYEFLGRILNKKEFRDVAIIIISHLERIKEKYKWNNVIKVGDGQVIVEGD